MEDMEDLVLAERSCSHEPFVTFVVWMVDRNLRRIGRIIRRSFLSFAVLFSSVSAGVGALWGPLHGGANCEVIKMLTDIHEKGIDPKVFVEQAKDKTSGVKLMGFGHRVYKSFDPRAKILKGQVDNVLKALNIENCG